MTEVSELVALLSKAERGYTKVLNRSFQNAGYDLSGSNMNFWKCYGNRIM